jgi:hypothetical protein
MKNVAFVINDEDHARYIALPRGTAHMHIWLVGLKAEEERVDREFEAKLTKESVTPAAK